MDPLGRLCTFSPEEFERFVLECADGYLAQKVPRFSEIQQRGGAGDKGRDIVVRLGELGSADRYWNLFQYERYSGALGDICKVLYFDSIGDFTLPNKYWFVPRGGVTGGLHDPFYYLLIII